MSMADDMNAERAEQQRFIARLHAAEQASLKALEQHLSRLVPDFVKSALALNIRPDQGILRKCWNIELRVYDGTMISGEWPSSCDALVRIYTDGTWIHLGKKWKPGTSTFATAAVPTETQVRDALKEWLRVKQMG
ncbi:MULTISPECIES: hypothetical protein [unclassified Rhodococcus (in: high G+C Gram-positive bacteria)]|uniref:hypothetical protein n=1 Tax=unclassified Rhodococcus (in: high G+C Gram-positive bacteria) TaxID=192944 RepID=UPI0012E37451|nr:MULTISPECIES: hypothetical protein [unclassified Rhodococcus (in: high G+C Gram-positive bacteria)]